METFQFKSGYNCINGTAQTPISNTETAVIDVKLSADTGDTKKVPFITGNTQGTFGFQFVKDTVTTITVRLYFYRYEVNLDANPFQSTTYLQTNGQFEIFKQTFLLTAANYGASDRVSFDFALPASDGIKMTVASAGTVGASALNEVFLAFRTN